MDGGERKNLVHFYETGMLLPYLLFTSQKHLGSHADSFFRDCIMSIFRPAENQRFMVGGYGCCILTVLHFELHKCFNADCILPTSVRLNTTSGKG